MRSVAFLRAINTGNRRVTNIEICRIFGEHGFAEVEGFLASGNVVFTEPEVGASEDRIEEMLEDALGYTVPTFVRSGQEIARLAETDPLPREGTEGRLQVAFLKAEPSAERRRAVQDMATPDDLLAISGRELFWLPKRGISDSGLNVAKVEDIVGPMTIRTHRTVTRLLAKVDS